jgi:hypothetical protein
VDLHNAVWAGDGARVREQLEMGRDVDEPDDWGHPALFVACLSEVSNPAVVAILREHGADPYHGKAYKRTPRAQAYDRYLLSGVDALSDLPPPEPSKTEAGELTDEEMEATVAAVCAVVERDWSRLEEMLAHAPGSDPYVWTRGYGRWGDVHFVMPPGDPRSWVISVIRGDEDGPRGVDWLAVDVEMWTREECRSDLTLELELRHEPDRSLKVELHNLHVM